MGYREVMSLPIRAFWLMNYSVGRVLAESDLRALTVQQASHGGEYGDQVKQSLVIELGEPWKTAERQRESPLDAERDHEGFEALRALAAML